jgi:hypothetical protein
VWYRVFGTSDMPPDPAALLEHLHAVGLDVTGRFHGDEEGWFRAGLAFRAAGDQQVILERYLSTEEGIRGELNAWAAWLEAAGDGREHRRLMQHLISTRQVFTLSRPDHALPVEHLCRVLCRYLARRTAGVYQVDGEGFFAADGTLLARESS